MKKILLLIKIIFSKQVYDLDFNLLNTKKITNDQTKLQTRLTKFNNGNLHYVIKSNKCLTHYIYNLENEQTKEINVDIEIKDNQSISNFSIKSS